MIFISAGHYQEKTDAFYALIGRMGCINNQSGLSPAVAIGKIKFLQEF